MTGIATIPEFAWDLSLGIYLIVKGFKPSPLATGTIPAMPTTRSPGAPSQPAPATPVG